MNAVAPAAADGQEGVEAKQKTPEEISAQTLTQLDHTYDLFPLSCRPKLALTLRAWCVTGRRLRCFVCPS